MDAGPVLPDASPNDGYLFPAPPRVLAHRGFALDAPENTLLAFLKALSLGVTHLETDVYASSDGIAVISHDPDLSRLVGRDIRVRDLTLAELGEIDLGHDQSFSSLDEALAAFPEARFNIDIKSPDAVGPTVDTILAAGATSRVLITSFSERRRRAAVRRLPGVATSASSTLFALAFLFARLGITPLLRVALRGIDAVQVPERYYGIRIVTPRLIRQFHSVPVEVHAWTVNDPAVMRRLLEMGVDGLVTDRVDLALHALEQLETG